jgi:sugar lactone lactonase YvrE
MCFSPDGTLAYFTDTRDARILAQPLDAQGWPKGDPHVFADLRPDKLLPDGSVIDAEGNMWNAQYAAARVAVYGPDGTLKDVLPIPATYTTCPAFGGPDLTTLYCTTARQDAPLGMLDDHPENGMTFAIPNAGKGQPEHRVIL